VVVGENTNNGGGHDCWRKLTTARDMVVGENTNNGRTLRMVVGENTNNGRGATTYILTFQ
jgi:hypothetical protein